tara:strand:- start:265 stop:498 length:234 start_codon:yes stop_codon:yes gene_type:complete
MKIESKATLGRCWRLVLKLEKPNGEIHYRQSGFCADNINARKKMEYFNRYIAFEDKAIGFITTECKRPEWWIESEKV